MRPVLFSWRRLTIHSYPAMLYIGLTLGVVAGNYAAHFTPLNTFSVFVASIILIIPALGGARLLHVAANWKFYNQHRSQIWNLKEGGMAQYGGILLAVPLSVPLLAELQLPFGAFWDVGSFTILVGMIFTRIGCLLNGCCAGRPSTSRFSIRLPNHQGIWTGRIPTQLMEAGWASLLLGAASLLWHRLPFDGALFVFVAAGYAFGRLALESLRDSSQSKKFTLHHAISLFIIGLSLAALTGRALM